MSEQEIPEAGSKPFWQLYDEFCEPEHLQNFIKENRSDLAPTMRKVMVLAHENRSIHKLSRPERGWHHHKAWLSLRSTLIMNLDGYPFIFMRVGDVVVVEFQWNRDVPITHNPIPTNIQCDYLLSGKWDNMVGLFMPLFDHKTIMTCIEMRTAKNVLEALELAEKEAFEFRWP